MDKLIENWPKFAVDVGTHLGLTGRLFGVVILILQRTLEYISFPTGAGTGIFRRDTEMRPISLRLTFLMTSWRSGPRDT